MSGAYVAKAGLNYSLVMSLAGTSLLAGDAVAVIGSFRLNGTSRTVEPGDPTITWTASIAGSPVNLRIDGVGDYGASVTSEAADNGVYWQSSVSLEFKDIGAATDQTLTVTCAGVIGGIDCTDYRTTTVPDYSMSVTGPAQVLTKASAACVARFLADGTDKTAEPFNKTITWSATIGGNPIDLRVGSSGGYASTATDTAADNGSFWQASSSLEFDLSTTDSDRTMIVTGAGVIEGLAVNDTASITIPGWPDANYSYNADLDGVFQFGSEDFWEVRCSIAVRLISNNDLVWFKRWYAKADQFQAVTSGEYAETNPENDPGDVTPTITINQGGFPGVESDITIAIRAAEQNPLYKYIFVGDVIGTRTVSGTAEVTHTGTVTNIVTGVERAADTQNATFIQAAATGSLQIIDDQITRVSWTP